jgi:hypothetical protein
LLLRPLEEDERARLDPHRRRLLVVPLRGQVEDLPLRVRGRRAHRRA